jgi:uncharacterized FAD-dependent dehydrogenase
MYDFIIVGAGPCGIFAAYEARKLHPAAKILILESGRDIYNRSCPIAKLEKCPPNGCKPACSITSGFGGAGAYSDGKYNITTGFGGWLTEYMNEKTLLELINYADEINLAHGAPTETTDPNTEAVREIEQKAYGAGLKLLRAQVRHLGTEMNLRVLKSIFDKLSGEVEMRFGTDAADILVTGENTAGENAVSENAAGKTAAGEAGKQPPRIAGVVTADGEEIFAKNVLLAPGRNGSAWLEKTLSRRGINMWVNQVDIGVRAETSDVVMHDINRHLYEAKFLFNSSTGTVVRTFCANPSGHVVVENHGGIIAVNGHAFRDSALGSQNTNFALLVSHKFTRPFNKPNEFAREICRRANDLSDGGVIIQRLGDLQRGRRSTPGRITEGFLTPTLKEAVPGDLGLVLPYNTLKSLLEMTRALDKVTPGFGSEHTLFYGVEAKFYSARPDLDANLQTPISGLYCGGDGAGTTRGLAQAAAAGVHIARGLAL